MKHQWTRRFELLSSEVGENYLACRRCGAVLRADKKNENKPCPGLVKITMRKKKKRAPKKPKA